jgi:hypothetical protein
LIKKKILELGNVHTKDDSECPTLPYMQVIFIASKKEVAQGENNLIGCRQHLPNMDLI